MVCRLEIGAKTEPVGGAGRAARGSRSRPGREGRPLAGTAWEGDTAEGLGAQVFVLCL